MNDPATSAEIIDTIETWLDKRNPPVGESNILCRLIRMYGDARAIEATRHATTTANMILEELVRGTPER